MSQLTKFRTWQNNDLAAGYEKVHQILSKLEETASSIEGPWPDSIIPTDILASICLGYVDMYEKLTETELVTGGYVKNTKTLH